MKQRTIVPQASPIVKQHTVSSASRKRKSTDGTPMQSRKKTCTEMTAVAEKDEHFNHIDKFKKFEELPPRELTKLFDNVTEGLKKQPRKKSCEGTYRIPTVCGRGAHSKHIDNCKIKIQKRKQ